MTHILSPGNNDEDFVEVLTHNAKVQIKKQSQHAGSALGAGTVKQGKLKQAVKSGRIVEFHEAGQGSTTEVEKVVVDDTLKISFKTQTSLYELLAAAPEHRKASLKYLRQGYLDFNDVMPDGFYDGGRQMTFEKDAKGILRPRTGNPARELIMVDANKDKALERKMELARKIVESVSDPSQKVLALAQFISNVSGGSQLMARHPGAPDIVSLSENEVSAYRKNQNGDQTVLLGYLNYGVCRHRATLFKYFADRLGIRSRMIRGNTTGGHVWNIVDIGGKYYVVDVMNNPFSLVPTDDPSVAHYRREDGRGYRGGRGGNSIPVT